MKFEICSSNVEVTVLEEIEAVELCLIKVVVHPFSSRIDVVSQTWVESFSFFPLGQVEIHLPLSAYRDSVEQSSQVPEGRHDSTHCNADSMRRGCDKGQFEPFRHIREPLLSLYHLFGNTH